MSRQLLVIAAAMGCAMGVATTASVAHAQMDPPPMDPPPTIPPQYAQFSGSWTEADPFTTTMYFGDDYKTVNEQWMETTTGDNLAYEQHGGIDYAAGESWIRGSQGNVTFCYLRFQGNWILVNCLGFKGITKDADTQAIEKNVEPWVEYLSEDSYTSTQQNLIVTAPAIMLPGQPVVDANFDLISYSLEQGRTWNYLGVATTSWDYQLKLPENLTTGWMEQYDPVENGVQVTHVAYWVDFEEGQPVQKQEETVTIRPQ